MGTVKQYDEEFNNRMFNYIHKNVKIKIKMNANAILILTFLWIFGN